MFYEYFIYFSLKVRRQGRDIENEGQGQGSGE